MTNFNLNSFCVDPFSNLQKASQNSESLLLSPCSSSITSPAQDPLNSQTLPRSSLPAVNSSDLRRLQSGDSMSGVVPLVRESQFGDGEGPENRGANPISLLSAEQTIENLQEQLAETSKKVEAAINVLAGVLNENAELRRSYERLEAMNRINIKQGCLYGRELRKTSQLLTVATETNRKLANDNLRLIGWVRELRRGVNNQNPSAAEDLPFPTERETNDQDSL